MRENQSAMRPGQAEPLTLLKRIGSTTFEVSVHFSTESEETLEDIILRLLEKEALQA
jgi:hypothetical protein